MIFSQLRSCFVTTVKPFAGSDDTIRIRWQRAAPGALVFPHAHAYEPNLWGSDFAAGYEGIGEVAGAPHTWTSNAASTLPGTHFEGPAEWFLTGVPPDHRGDPSPICADSYLSSSIALAFNADNGIFSVLESNADFAFYASSTWPHVDFAFSASGRIPAGALVSNASFAFSASGRIPAGALVSFANLAFEGVGLVNSAATVWVVGQSMPAGATTAIAFGASEIDTDGYWSGGAPTLLTMPADGRYLFSVNLQVAPAGAGLNIIGLTMVFPSGVNPQGAFECNPALPSLIGLTWIKDLLAGDTVHFNVQVVASANANINAYASVTQLKY